LNSSLFLAINASAQPGALAFLFAQLMANAPLLLAPALLAGLWFWGRPARRAGLIATGFGVFAGQAINLSLGQLVYQPRPFMVGIGHTWIAHVADNGFPSDHATLAWSLGLGLVLTESSRRWGVFACLVGVAAGWARVYLGVHFPFDVVASAAAGLLAATLARTVLPMTRRYVLPQVERVPGLRLSLAARGAGRP